MSIIKILQYPDPKLKRKGLKVSDFGASFQSIVDDMIETYHHAKNCAALAATQLDIPNAPHLTVIHFEEGLLPLVNATITHTEGVQKEEEACMSVGEDYERRVFASVKRAKKIKLEYQDRYGKFLNLEAEDFMAKCIQHELDHLNGIIFLDRLSPLKREILEKKLDKLKKLDQIKG